MSIRTALTAAAAALLLSMGTASAQGTAPAAAPAAKTAKAAKPAKKAPAPRSAASLQCSKDADAKGLKGKERKKFRSSCMNAAKKAAAPKS